MTDDKDAAARLVPPPVRLSDINAQYRLLHCRDCGHGGHTGHTLFKVVSNVVNGTLDYACEAHVTQYVRPGDVRRGKR